MRIPNKFNGYSADNIRLYNDPVTLAALATTGTGAAMGTTAAAAAGSALAGGATAAGLGAAGLGAAGSALAPAAVSALTPAATSALTAAAPSALQTAGLEAAKQQAISQGLGNMAANQATNLSVQNALANQGANALANQGIAGASKFASAAGNNAANYSQVADAFSRPNLGQGFQKLGPDLAGPADPTSFAKLPNLNNQPSWLNTTTEGSAIPGVTSNLPGQNLGNIAGGPAIPNVTSSLPVQPPSPLVPGSVSPIEKGASFTKNFGNLIDNPSWSAVKDYAAEHPYATSMGVGLGTNMLVDAFNKEKPDEPHPGMVRPYELERTANQDAFSGSTPGGMSDSSERNYFTTNWTALEPYRADRDYKAEGGLTGYGPMREKARNLNKLLDRAKAKRKKQTKKN
jgi:hypothetical protein